MNNSKPYTEEQINLFDILDIQKKDIKIHVYDTDIEKTLTELYSNIRER